MKDNHLARRYNEYHRKKVAAGGRPLSFVRWRSHWRAAQTRKARRKRRR